MFRRNHYRVIIRGLESGNVTRLPFLEFTTEGVVKKWVDEANGRFRDHHPPLIRYEYEEIDE